MILYAGFRTAIVILVMVWLYSTWSQINRLITHHHPIFGVVMWVQKLTPKEFEFACEYSRTSWVPDVMIPVAGRGQYTSSKNCQSTSITWAIAKGNWVLSHLNNYQGVNSTMIQLLIIFALYLTCFGLQFLNWTDSIFDNLESKTSIIINVLELN